MSRYSLIKIKLSINNKRGFTLIELLVVISIIGLLSTVVLASVQKARNDAKWRTFERQLVEIRTAVQLYRTNNNGNWPNSMNWGTLENLLSDLKNSGVYSTNKISYPETSFDANSTFIAPSNKVVEGAEYSCGNQGYKDAYYVLAFYNPTNMFKPYNTKFPFYREYEYVYDNPTDGYIYCIDFR